MTESDIERIADGLTAVMVDDEPYLLNAVKRSMRGFSHSLLLFSYPLDALEELRRMQHVAVVVSDYQMPGMNGSDLLMRVKELHPASIRILSSASPSSLDYARQQGVAHRYLDKSEFVLNVREIIDKALAEYLK